MHVTHVQRWFPFLCGLLGSGVAFVSVEAGERPIEAPQPGFQLRYQFRPNQVLRYEVVHKMTIETRKGDASQSAVNESKTHKHYRVAAVDSEGVGTLESVIDRVKLTARFGDSEPVVYDSDSPPPPPQFDEVHKTIGKPIVRVKVAPNGEFLSVNRLLPQELQNSVTSGTGGGAPDTDRSKNFLVIFPEEPVHVGETWTDHLQVPVKVSQGLRKPVKLLRRFRLESVEDGLATIRLRTSVITPISDPHVRAELIQRTPEGTIVFDLKRGVLVSRNLSVDKTEVGVFGPNSLMRAQSTRTEKLVSPKETTRAARAE